MEIIPLLLIILVCSSLLAGYPVAFTLAGVSIIFALICSLFGIFDLNLFKNLPIRIFGIMNNQTLLAVPLFVFMGVVLERSGIAAKMLQDMAKAFTYWHKGRSWYFHCYRGCIIGRKYRYRRGNSCDYGVNVTSGSS